MHRPLSVLLVILEGRLATGTRHIPRMKMHAGEGQPRGLWKDLAAAIDPPLTSV